LIPGDKLGRTYAQAITDAVVARALKGEISAVGELADRVEGKPIQAVRLGREESDVDTRAIIERLAGARTLSLESGGTPPDSGSSVEQ